MRLSRSFAVATLALVALSSTTTSAGAQQPASTRTFTQAVRARDVFKAPGIAETLDWAEALVALDRIALDPQTITDTIGVLLKYQDDIGAITPDVAASLLAQARLAS